MLDYVICEIEGKQYKVVSGKELVVAFAGDDRKEIEANVLLLAEGGKVKVGKPFLKDKIILKILENLKGKKIRVSKFHAKANYRRVSGVRMKLTRVMLKA